MISITTILKELSSQSLIYWANNIGLDWVKLSDYYKKSSKNWIDKHNELQKEFLEKWYKDYKTVWIEISVEHNDICGRIDFIAEKDWIIYIFDIKSSNTVYLSQVLQLLAYKKLYTKIHNISSEQVKIWIIQIDTKEEKIIELEDDKKYYDILNALYTISVNRNILEYK